MTPTILKCGGGVETTGLICGMIERGEKADAVIFADTGAERDYTYENIGRLDVLIRAHGWAGIQTVYYTRADGTRETLEGHSLRTRRMPSKSYGRKSCSVRFKHEPSDKWLKSWAPAVAAWEAGQKPTMIIGYNVDEVRRWMNAPASSDRYVYDYRLVRWKWGRDECKEAAARFGLYPRKSACYFCGSARPFEVLRLREEAPDLFARGSQSRTEPGRFRGRLRGSG